MASIKEVTNALKAVDTIRKARIVIQEAIVGVNGALRADPAMQGDLERSLGELLAWKLDISKMQPNAPYQGPFRARQSTIIRAYVNIAGAMGEIQARQTISLWDELVRSGGEVAEGLGRGVTAVAGGAGSVVGSVLKGIGPILILIVVAAIVIPRMLKGKT